MRTLAIFAAGLGLGLFALVPTFADADTTKLPPQASPKSLASGAYILVMSPKKLGGSEVKTVRPIALPVVVKTDGKTLVIGGKYAPQLTGTISEGKIALKQVSGTGGSLAMDGSTFNGYAASGSFKLAQAGSFEGTYALVTVSKAGVQFMNARGAGVGQNRGQLTGSGMSGYLPSGVSGSWGYDGPGYSGNGFGGNNNGFALPGSVNGNNAFDWSHPIDSLEKALNDKDDTSSKPITPSKPAPGDPGSVGAARAAFEKTAPAKDDCWFFCGGSSDTSSSSSSSTTGGVKTGFTAGDWEPVGGDTSPGQKPKTGNGQDTGNGNQNAGAVIKPLSTGGDPSELFQPKTGDILNGNKLFNGASDPPRGANFGR